MQHPVLTGLRTITLALFAAPALIFAQTAATIVGDVTDPTGAAVPGASITITHDGTGAVRQVQTNEAGQYRATPLNPGVYTLRVETAGFKSQLRPNITLEVAAVLEIDFTLELGEVTETIEVTGAAPVLQTEEASVGGVVNAQQLQRLPVNERNYTKLILLVPGASSVTRSQSRGTGESGTRLFSVNGGRPQDNNYTLDGFDSNMQMMNSPGISPPMDALQEFKVATNNGAEFGRSMGANVSMVIKSGTNQLHGSAYEFLRNDKLDAAEFFANRNASPKAPFRQNQFGFTLGGPLVLPGGKFKNKMFWFVSYEGFRRRRGDTQLSNVPTADLRAGDFSSLLNQADPVTITDPLNGDAPFANNIIPQARINPAVPAAFDLLVPLPNRPGQVQNFVTNRGQANNRDGIHWRYDYNINEKNTFFFRFSLQNANLSTPNANPNFDGVSEFDVFNYGASWTHIFGPTTTLEVGFGTNQPENPGLTTNSVISRADFFQRTGIQMFQVDVFGDPVLNIDAGAFSLPGGGGDLTGDNVYQWRANLNTIRGKHSLKFGGQYHFREFFTNTSNPMNGNADFNGQISGFPFADALLGFPTEIRRGQGVTLTDGVGHFMTGHVQDDWRVSDKLTVNLGLTYQFGSRPYDRSDQLGNLQVLRDPTTGQFSAQLLWATTNPAPAPAGGILPTDQPFETGLPTLRAGFGRALVDSDKNDFAPRIGIAYKLNDKTVIRSGFGVFYNSTFVQELQDLRKFWPFTIQQVFSPNRGGIDLSITDVGPSFESTAEIGGWPQNPENRSPYSMQWNFFIQRQLMDDLSLDIGYVGSASRKQIGYSPFNNALTPGPGAIGPRRLLPFLGDLDGGSNQFSGSYNALQATLNKRFSGGMQFNFNYTYSKSLDGQSSLAESNKTQDPFNRAADFSRSSWDIRHAMVFSYVYELPFGRGRAFGGDAGGVANMIVGGWSLEGITRLESGPPINVSTDRDIANTGRSTQRPNLVGDPNDGPGTADEFFNTSAFAVPAEFTFGNAAPFITDSDGIVSIDLAIQKVFPIREGHQLEFRGEFFNITNQVSFSDPDGNMNSASFGRVSSQRVPSRQVQLALRYRF